MKLKLNTLLLTPLILILNTSLYSLSLNIASKTFPRFIDSASGDNTTGLYVPTYEYLTLGIRDFGVDGLTFHASGWGRIDFGQDPDDKTGDGNLLYGYLDYRDAKNRLHARLGRQFLFSGVALDNIDGIIVDSTAPYGLFAEAFAGKPVLSKSEDISSDILFGGRVGYKIPWKFSVGLSFLDSLENGDADRQNIGIDGFARPVRIVELSWRLFYSILFEEIYEGSVKAVVSPVKKLKISLNGELIDPKARLGTSSIFSVFADRYIDAGLRVDYCIIKGLTVNASYANYQYRVGEDSSEQANRLGAGATYSAKLLGDNLFGVSFEQLKYSENQAQDVMTGYYQIRVFTENTFIEKVKASAEFIHTIYDEYIHDYNGSDDISLSAGYQILKDLNILGSFYYSINPRYTQEMQGSIFINYVFGATI